MASFFHVPHPQPVARAVVLMGHGSREPAGAAEFVALAGAAAAALDEPVAAGVLEFWGPEVPPIQAAFDRAAASGADEVVAQPVLLFFAGHARRDVVGQVQLARKRYPHLTIRLGEPIGLHPALLHLAGERAADALARCAAPAGQGPGGQVQPHEAAVLLVGRGSFDAEANADLFKIARLVWEQQPWGWVEACFVSLALPTVAEGIERCVRLGARCVLVVPYFLNTGVLVRRIAAQAREAAVRHPGVTVAVGRHLGVEERVVQALRDAIARAAAAGSGHADPSARLPAIPSRARRETLP